eukprot:CAMPEP_0204380292 /NCGR_PEP_ID=MMETSP0469-20131031/53268_1 /ASSEMBLY_ACC=CAM_ASM_000384 /TAXON_ID=2969 /ORGANISM="Oxyrrhis marina" /LENGTH=201 /DNA_ID=CAMNT_0051371901 /DNA_START=66 /DNA_END=672 /DNA_ORIENTATION=-
MEVEVLQSVDGIGILFLCVLMYLCVANPILTIVVCCVFGSTIKCDDCQRGSEDWQIAGAVISFLAAAFIGAISYVVFDFVKRTVLGCVDAIFVCYAFESMEGQSQTHDCQTALSTLLGRDCVAKQERFAELYTVIKEIKVVSGVPATVTPVTTPPSMQVQCPQGVSVGQMLQVQAPSGAMIQVTVPEGTQPGGMFAVVIPA